MQWGKLLRALTVDDSVLSEQFVLTPEREDEQSSGNQESGNQSSRPRRGKSGGGRQSDGSSQGGQQSDGTGDARSANDDASASVAAGGQERQSAVQRGAGRLRVYAVLARYGEHYSKKADRSEQRSTESGPDVNIVHGQHWVTPPNFAEWRARAAMRSTGGGAAREVPRYVQRDLRANRQTLARIFHLPTNQDLVLRPFQAGGQRSVAALAAFIDGLADKTIINNGILQPLMLLSSLHPGTLERQLIEWVRDALLPGNQVSECATWEEVVDNILAGSTVVFLEGVPVALSVETKGWEHRQVSAATTESVVRGPHDAFTESFRANTGLVRSRLRSEKLVTEIIQVGDLATTDVAIMYITNIANPALIREMKRRIRLISVDYVPDSGLLEQFIEDDPIGVIPKLLSTERPDRVAYALSEGQVAVFVGHSPFVLLAPTVVWSLLHTSEDAYLRWPFGTFIRTIRLLSLFVALLLPALYIAVTNYHPEMIPTDLMLAVASSRERVPFPVVVEVLIMEFSIELIREAGIRIPTVIGPTIGIVGALILGQAAVAAGIISPLLIIVVAVTALGSFTLPNYNLSFSVRVLRFLFITVAAVLGFYGIVLGLMVLLMHIATLRSFGVPVLAPLAPRRKSSPDVLWRGRVYEMEEMPLPYWPLRRKRQNTVTRSWSPIASALRDSGERGRAVRQSAGENGGKNRP